MSDPFTDIDSEVYIEKIKSFFSKFKFIIFIILATVVLAIVLLSYYNNLKINKELEASNYYVEILSIIHSDQDRALRELKKLSKFDQKNYQNLSNLLILKIKLQDNKLDEALEILKKLENNLNSKNKLNRILNYYYAQIYLDKKNKIDFESYINKLLSYGGMWAMLAYELRGHFFFHSNEYDLAKKNFNKIIDNQQATGEIRSRAKEMINNINLNHENN